MFRKSRQVIRNALQRLYHALRRQVRGIEVFSLDCSLRAVGHTVRFGFSPGLLTLSLVPSQPVIKSEDFDCPIAEVNPSLDAEIRVDESPTHTDVTVIDMASERWSPDVIDCKADLPAPRSGAVDPDFTRLLRAHDWPAVRLKAKVLALGGRFAVEVKDGERTMRAQPIRRKGLNFYRLPAHERVAFWNELIAQVGKSPKELELVGVFPLVPKKGLRRVGFRSGSTELQVWIDQAASGAPAGTLILARERSSNRLYRVFDSRAANSSGPDPT
jgi:hypothetical protein